MDKTIIIMIFIVLMTGNVLAFNIWDLDNGISYSENVKTVTIKNGFGLGTEVAKIELKSPLEKNYIEVGEDRPVLIMEIDNKKEYKEAIRNMEILNIKTGEYENKEYYFAIPIYENISVDDYTMVCEDVPTVNGTDERCEEKKTGNHIEERVKEWQNINSVDLPEGKFLLALITDVEEGDHYDGIPTFFGKRIDKWAAWEAIVIDTHGENLNNAGADTGEWGMRLLAKYNLRVVSVNKSSDSNAVECWLYGADFATLANSTYSGDECVFPDLSLTNITSGTEFFVVNTGTNNGSFTHDQKNTVDQAYPVEGTAVNWTGARFKGTNSTTLAAEIMNISTQKRNPVITPSVFLLAPPNASTQTNGQVSFVANSTTDSSIGGNLTNTTLYVWFDNSTLVGSNFTALGGEENNATNLSLYIPLIVDDYLWNFYTCAVNATDTECAWADDNRSFDVQFFSENEIIYNTTIYETTIQTFAVNITSGSASDMTATFYYNNVSYGASTKAQNGNDVVFSNTFTIPLLSGEGNTSFYWEVTDGLDAANTTITYDQSSNYVVLDLCNASLSTPFINFTFKDESTDTAMDASVDSSSWTYWTDNSSVNKSLTFSETSPNTSYGFCVSPSYEVLDLELNFKYSSTSYPQRTFIYEGLITNTTIDQALYLLGSADGQYVTFEVVDATGSALESVDVTGNRTIGGTSEIVSQGITDAAGTVTFWLDPDFAHTFLFEKEGYDNVIETITPTQSLYTVMFGGAITTTQPSNYLREVNIQIQPTDIFLTNDTTYGFNYTISSSYWSLDEWGFVLKYGNGTTIGTQTSTVGTGGILNIDANTQNNTRIIMEYYYVANSTYINKSKTWQIYIDSGFGLSQVFSRINTYIDQNILGILGESGDDYFSKALISVVIIILIAGILNYRYGSKSEAFLLGILFGLILFLNSIGFIPNPDFLENSTVSLGDLLVFLIGILIIGFIIREERR